jgi:Ankyrin repeats (3 copies)
MVSAPTLGRVQKPHSTRRRSASARIDTDGYSNRDSYTFSTMPEYVDGTGIKTQFSCPRKIGWGLGGNGYRGTMLHKLAAKVSVTDAEIKRHISSIDKPDVYGQTPLMRAAWYDRLETVKLLIANGANIDVRDRFYKDVFTIAARRGNLATFKYLIDTYMTPERKLAMIRNNHIRDEYMLAILNSHINATSDRMEIQKIISNVLRNINLRWGDIVKFVQKMHISAIIYVKDHVKHDLPPGIKPGEFVLYDTNGIIKTQDEWAQVLTAYNKAIKGLCKYTSILPSATSRGGRGTYKKRT